MEINTLESKKNRLVFELHGADHTFCNALKQELWNDEKVKISAYHINHPQVGVPKFVLESSGDAKDALKDAVKRLEKQRSGFMTAFAKL